MKSWFNIAIRNLLKNRRRSLFTVLAIALGFSAVTLFGAFTSYMYAGNREGSIYSSYMGHILIARKGLEDSWREDPKKFLLTPEEIAYITQTCQQMPEILLIAPQMRINGLISDGKTSTIFVAQGIVPAVQDVFARETKLRLMEPYEGKPLSDTDIYGVGISKGLAKILKLDLGSEAVIMGTTVDGQMNAFDVTVSYLFNAPAAAINERFLRVPFQLAQKLYDTDGAHYISLLLKDTNQTEAVRAKLTKIFADAHRDLGMKTWKEISEWYNKVKEMFDMIFFFLFAIVFIIVVMSVINTMSMSVMERTREIGTLRALGLKRLGIIRLFAIESGLLAIGGILGGGLLSFVGWLLVYALEPKWTPPGITARIPLQLYFSTSQIIVSMFFLLILCMSASILPARKAANRNIVDALGHV
ncbi:MAG: FtsX-like permease family protein [Thermodesulfobacteriota bacterium]